VRSHLAQSKGMPVIRRRIIRGLVGWAALVTVSAVLAALVGLEVATGVGLGEAPAGAATAETCGFATPGTGTYASTLCWLDLSGYSQSLATAPGGQAISVSLPGGLHHHVQPPRERIAAGQGRAVSDVQ
jgi:hypothetical protein